MDENVLINAKGIWLAFVILFIYVFIGFFIFSFIYFAVLWIKPRSSHMLDRHSVTGPHIL